jgi:regulatory protein
MTRSIVSARPDRPLSTEPSCGPAERVLAVEQVLNSLAQAGLLSDDRFSHSRVRQRQARFGNRRIERELRQHGVEASAEQWAELQESEKERAVIVLRSRFQSKGDGPVDLKELQKAQRFLAGRGFSGDAIRAAMRDWDQGLPEEGSL